MFKIMKTNFWKSAAGLVLGLTAMVACEDDKPVVVDPVFPSEVIEQNVAASEEVEIKFEANLDWELSIPASEQNKYWLDDAGMPASKVSGKAGNQTVTVVFSEDEYYDANVVCEVTLSMGGQSKVIAKLTRLAINRTLEVYTAKIGEWGFDDEFNTTKAEAIELTTFEGDPLYAMPVKVVANFDWNLSLPAWCKGEVVAEGAAAESLSGKAGQAVELVLAANLTAEVKDGASDFAKFIDAADNSKTIEIALSLPAFADRLEVSEPASLDFAVDGTSARPSISYVLGMEGFVVRALGFNGEWHDTSYADWVTAEIENGNPESTEVLTLSAVYFSAAENTGKERVADIFIFPASMANVSADAICDSNSPTCAFLPEYEKYYVGRLTQAGKAAPYISEYNDMMSGVETYKATLTTYEASQWWASMVGGLAVNNQYELTYWDQSSELTFNFDSPYASYKIFDYDFNEVTGAALDTFWIWFTSWSDKGKVMMDPSFFNNPYAESPESFIVFYDESGKALAGICCKYTAASTGGDSSTPISVKSGNAEASVGLSGMGLPEGTLNQIISGLGVGTAQTEMLIMASESEVEFTANFNIGQIWVLNGAGAVETPAGFTCYQSSYTDFKVTAASGTECILLFMDIDGNLPVVAYYSFY
jgi:hypothetical protein